MISAKHLISFLALSSFFGPSVLANDIHFITQNETDVPDKFLNGIQRDVWEPEKRWNIIDSKNGLPSGGFIKRDRWEPGKKWNIYDKDGTYKGTIERDTWEPEDRWNIAE